MSVGAGMQAIVGGLVAFGVVAGWLVVRWVAAGRDPSYLDDPSILMPAPPEGMTAATAAVVDGAPASTAFMAALFDLASRDEIGFRDETPDASGAHRIGIELRGGDTHNPRVLMNRRKPVGEGEAWLLANLRTWAAMPGGPAVAGGEDPRRMAELAAMSEMSGFLASAFAGGGGSATDASADPLAPGATPDLQAALITALERSGRPVPEHLRESAAERTPMLGIMHELLADPSAVAADPEAFASRVESATGHRPTPDEMAELNEWLRARGATAATAATLQTSPGADAVPAGALARDAGAPEAAAPVYIPAQRATQFHPPIGFATFVENYARRKGWIRGLSFVARWKWQALAIVEVIAGLGVAATDRVGQGVVYGIGLGIAAGGIATWLGARFMASRTHEGAVMKAQLAAYRRTLAATFAASATLDDAVTASGLKWLETPDQALVWGVALGLRHDIEQLLRRTTKGIENGSIAAGAFLPRWIGRAGSVVARVAAEVRTTPAGATTPVQPPPASQETGDYAAVFAGIERIGSAPVNVRRP